VATIQFIIRKINQKFLRFLENIAR